MPPKQTFADGEIILCFHGPLLYKAKCLKSIVTVENLVKYYVHYAGWSKNQDEWVPETRVLKYNEANIAKQDELQTEFSAEIKGKKGRGHKSDKTATSFAAATVTEASGSGKHTLAVATSTESVPEPTKRKRGCPDSNEETEEQYLFKNDINILLPDVVKTWLVNDWYRVTTNSRIVHVPAKLTVDEIVDNYLMHKKVNRNNICYGTLGEELIEGLKEYFNMTLEPQLLYKSELPQYEKLRYTNQAMSSIYGAVHLLRLLSKLEVMLAYAPLGERSIQILKSSVEDFLNYFVQNCSSFFRSQCYTSITDQYFEAEKENTSN